MKTCTTLSLSDCKPETPPLQCSDKGLLQNRFDLQRLPTKIIETDRRALAAFNALLQSTVIMGNTDEAATEFCRHSFLIGQNGGTYFQIVWCNDFICGRSLVDGFMSVSLIRALTLSKFILFGVITSNIDALI